MLRFCAGPVDVDVLRNELSYEIGFLIVTNVYFHSDCAATSLSYKHFLLF